MNNLMMSSVNPQKISLTIKSVIKGAIALLVMLGFNQMTGDVQAIGDNLIELIGIGLTAWSSIEAIYGAGRKIIVFLKTKFKKGE